MTQATTKTVYVHRVYIKATRQQVWEAITNPEWNHKYGYQCRSYYELHPGGVYKVEANEEMKAFGAPDIIIEGEVIESEPPSRLVQTWHGMFTEELSKEPTTRLTWELDEQPGNVTRLTLTHDVSEAPTTAAQISGQIEHAGGGWSLILSDLKTTLETGKSLHD